MRRLIAILPAALFLCFLGCEVDSQGTQIGNEGFDDTDPQIDDCRTSVVAGTMTYAGWGSDVDTVVGELVADVDAVQLVLATAFDGTATVRTGAYATGVEGDCSSVYVDTELGIDIGTTLTASFTGQLAVAIDDPTDMDGVLSTTTWTSDTVRPPSADRSLELRVTSVQPLTAELVEVDCTVNDPCDETVLGDLNGR